MLSQAQVKEEEARRLELHAAWEARQAHEEAQAKVCEVVVEDAIGVRNISYLSFYHFASGARLRFLSGCKPSLHRVNR